MRSVTRQGLDRLLEEFPDHDVVYVAESATFHGKPAWLEVHLMEQPQLDVQVVTMYAIHTDTGHVHMCFQDGTIVEPALLT